MMVNDFDIVKNIREQYRYIDASNTVLTIAFNSTFFKLLMFILLNQKFFLETN